ncbi:MAG TPA: guanylate kinase [Bryobacteraceae bacterium]|nr:guanylate kinase [Bryobacteraceae bacterium]
MTTVFIISAPSGSGKSTLVRQLLATVPGLMFSVSYTTRPPRGHETDGESYHFITHDDFEARLARDEFLEHAEVFGNYYGTHRGVLEQAREQGQDLVLDIDVQGARQLRDKIPEAVTIFVLAPSREILEQRLRARSEDAGAVIERRLRDAANEIRNYRAYDYVLINNDLTESGETLAGIVRAERVRRSRMEERIRPILETFENERVKD